MMIQAKRQRFLARGGLLWRTGLQMSVLLAGTGLGVSSCATERTNGTPMEPSIGHSAFITTAGTTHNNAVAYVLAGLQGIEGTRTEQQVMAIMRKLLGDYFGAPITTNQWNAGISAASMAGNDDH
ncbi:MAG: hypothetical protein ACREOG_21455, partial [Gemmatimonadaceae bacterium]